MSLLPGSAPGSLSGKGWGPGWWAPFESCWGSCWKSDAGSEPGAGLEAVLFLGRTLAERVGDHPVWAAATVLVAVLSALAARRLFFVPVAGFLAIAALVGLEPVQAPILRIAFALGCLICLIGAGLLARR